MATARQRKRKLDRRKAHEASVMGAVFHRAQVNAFINGDDEAALEHHKRRSAVMPYSEVRAHGTPIRAQEGPYSLKGVIDRLATAGFSDPMPSTFRPPFPMPGAPLQRFALMNLLPPSLIAAAEQEQHDEMLRNLYDDLERP